MNEEREYAVIDVETSNIADGEIPRTKFWGYADSRGYECFKTTAKLLKFLGTVEPKTLLHHSNFDVIQLLVDGCRDIKILKSHNGRLIKCTLENRHVLLNSFSAFPVALKKIFKAFGFNKTELDQLAKRNYEDCVNGLKCFLELDEVFQSLVFVSPLRRGTIASTGFGAAEKHAGKMPKDLRFLEAYRGGRVEVFNMRAVRAANYDIHSSYPASILECPATDYLLHVRVKTKDWHCPLFDAGSDEMLLFPNGSFESYVFQSNWEKYYEPYVDKTSIKILSRERIDFSWLCQLKELVRTIYDKKAASDGAIELCCKLLLNSLYGRIGLKGESERARLLDYIPDGDDITVHFLGGGQWLCFDKVQRESRSNFPFAAYITDNARGRQFSALKRNEPLYTDTDSVFTKLKLSQFRDAKGDNCGEWGTKFYRRCLTCGELFFDSDTCSKKHPGSESTDKQVYEKFIALNVKDYKWADKEVRKGGTEKDIWTMKKFAAGETAKHVVRTRRTQLRKRQVLPNGDTEPHTVNN